MSTILASGKISGILAVAAVSLSFGAVQLASGRDLSGKALSATGQAGGQTPDATNENGVNRGAKSDRARMPRTMAAPSQTIAVRLDRLPATSILIRLPARFADEAQDRSLAPGLVKVPVNTRKSTVACEPVVSVLTDIAKQLQPGRCVT
jgi:hypothetical protein